MTTLSELRRAQIMRAMSSEAKTVREIGAATGIDHTTIYNALAQLAIEGRAQRQDNPRWRQPKQPRHAWVAR